MEPMRLVVTGAGGRMGRALVRAVSESPGAALHAAVLHAAVERADSPLLGHDSGLLAGLPANGILLTDDARGALAGADGILDFTTPAASIAFAALAAEARCVHVIGTTGLSEADDAKLAAAARAATIVRSGNFSFGVNMLLALVRRAAASLGPDWDIEILEMHHRMKVDAPSGTALMIGRAAAEGRGVSLSNAAVRSRDGHTGARVEGTIGFQALRGGSVIGDHSAIFAGNGERIELRHIAEDRGLFASGAVKAALWARGRAPGLYSMDDVLGLKG